MIHGTVSDAGVPTLTLSIAGQEWAGLFSFKNYRFCVLLKVKTAGQVQRSKTYVYQLKDMRNAL